MFRRGRLPGRGEDTELEVHSWTRRGFFGSYATIYKTRNPGDALRWEIGLGPAAIDLASVRPSDADRADGTPLPLMTNGEVTISVSKRRDPMPYCWRNADADELYFVDRGHCLFETELGRLNAEPGELIVLPRNVVYRTIPQDDEQVHLILETVPLLESAEAYHRQHGETSSGLDMSVIEVPEPWENANPGQREYEVRTKVGGQVLSAVFDFDPVGVTVGWAGDPIVYKLNAWDVPCASLPSTPPTAAVFMTDDKEAVVTVHTPRAGGPPAHTNDYDELWVLHSADGSTGGVLGQLRWEPQGATQPGQRHGRRNGPPRPTNVVNLNIDVHKRLSYTAEARPYVVEASHRVAAGA